MSDQLLIDFDAPSARSTDPETSRVAAVLKFPDAPNDRLRVLTALVHAGAEGMTDFELEQATGIKQTSSGKRRGELRDGGFVEALMLPHPEHPCGYRPVKREAPSGALSQVWVLTAEGLGWAHAHGITGGMSC